MKKKNTAKQTEYLKSCIQVSFLTLLKDKAMSQISITNIANHAGVSRMSIYRYYDDKEDIVRKHIKDNFENYLNTVGELDLSAITSAPFFFEYFRKNGDTVKLLIEKNLFHLISDNFATYVEKFECVVNKKSNLPESHRIYNYGYTASGLLSIVKIWIESGMKESNEEMSEILKAVKLEQANF
ncbi:MAG: AcrR family transcriptional regulator [Oceanicoccus sp.]|jgi:AcrR family transcriptional regulator